MLSSRLHIPYYIWQLIKDNRKGNTVKWSCFQYPHKPRNHLYVKSMPNVSRIGLPVQTCASPVLYIFCLTNLLLGIAKYFYWSNLLSSMRVALPSCAFILQRPLFCHSNFTMALLLSFVIPGSPLIYHRIPLASFRIKHIASSLSFPQSFAPQTDWGESLLFSDFYLCWSHLL